MCVVSNIGDYWKDRLPEKYPWVTPQIVPYPSQPGPPTTSNGHYTVVTNGSFVPRHEFEALKKEMEELKVLLQAAIAFDKATGQPDCHLDDKVKLIKAVAKMVGVSMEDVFQEPKNRFRKVRRGK